MKATKLYLYFFFIFLTNFFKIPYLAQSKENSLCKEEITWIKKNSQFLNIKSRRCMKKKILLLFFADKP